MGRLRYRPSGVANDESFVDSEVDEDVEVCRFFNEPWCAFSSTHSIGNRKRYNQQQQ